MRRFLFAVIMIVACATGAVADSYEDAVSAYQRGDFALTARLLPPFAEQGYIGAQLLLGALYYGGLGVTQDAQEAVKWYGSGSV